jgi:diguanylate cyclase (GGDEF)-like protein
MTELQSLQGKTQLKKLFVDRLPDKLRQMVKLLSYGANKDWPAPVLRSLKLNLQRSIRSCDNFGLNDVSHTLKEVYLRLKTNDNYELITRINISETKALASKILKLIHHIQMPSPIPLAGVIDDEPDDVEQDDIKEDWLDNSDIDESLLISIGSPRKICIYSSQKELDRALKKQLPLFNYHTHAKDNLSDLDLDADAWIIAIDAEHEIAKDAIPLCSQGISRPPLLFIGPNELKHQLHSVRLGGNAYLNQEFDIEMLVKKLDYLTGGDSQPYRILIMEDSKAQSKFYARVLSKAGYETKVVNEPMQLIEAIVEFKPELILMDYQMPGCNGLELAQVIHQKDDYANIPIVFLSAEEGNEKRLRTLAVAGDDFLVKPIKADNLIPAIKVRVQRSRRIHQKLRQNPISGLLSNTSFMEQFQGELALASRNSTPLSIMVINIDNLQHLNHEYSYQIGDQTIKQLSALLAKRLRKSDVIGHYSDTNIGVVLPNCTVQQTMAIGEKIRLHFEQLNFDYKSDTIKATISIGSAQFEGGEPMELRMSASKALSIAKKQGGNRIISIRPSGNIKEGTEQDNVHQGNLQNSN